MTNKNLLKILFVEDLPSDAELAVLELRKEGLRFEHMRVDTRDEFIKALTEFKPDIIISDYMMPSFNGLQALKEVKEFNAEIPFILCTGSINEETAVGCIKAGATDYVIKEHLTRLPFAVKEALEQHRILIEKRAAELLLRENEEKLQSIFSAAPVGIGLVVNRVLIEVNDTFCKMTGYSRNELIGKSSELIYATKEEYESDGAEKYRQISEKGTGSVETRFKCKNGKILNIFLSSAPLDKDDLTKGVTFTALDVTRKKRAEEALLERDKQLSSIYDAVGDVIYHLEVEPGENYRFISVNHAFSTVTGLSEEMVVGKLVNEVIPESSITLVLGKYRQAIREKSIVKWEETSDYPNGRLIGDVSIAPVFDDKGQCTHLVGSVHDITKRKQAEEALQKSQHLFQTLARVSPVGIFRTDPDGYTTYVNPKYSDLTGLSPEEALGNGWLNAVHPDDKEKLKESWSSDFKSQKKSSSEYRFLRPDGSIIWVMGNAVPEWIDNKIVGYIGTITDINERKGAEEKLINSEERFKILFDYAPDAYYLSDLKGTFIDGNIAAEKLMGYSKNELIDKSFLKLKIISLSQILRAAKLLVKNSFGQSTGPDEFVLSRKDGSKVIVEISTHPVKIKGHTLVLGIARDISERKRAHEALIESEEKYRRIFENVQDLYYESSLDGTIIELSPSIESLSGGQYRREDLIGKSLYEFYSDPKTRLSLLSALKEKGMVSDFEITLKNHDGSLIPCSISSKIINDAQGRPEKIIGSMRDITYRKQAEEAIIDERRMLRTLIDNLPDHIYVKDTAGRKVISNTADFKDFGFQSEDQVLGKTDLEIFPFPTGQRGYDAEMEVLSSGKPVIGREEDFIYPDGKKHWFLSTMIPIIDNTGKINGLVGIGHDITERKHVEEELINAKEKAEESDRLKTAFLHNISHEIRTPMNAIVGFSAMLGVPDIDERTRKDYIEVIMQGSNHLLEIITDIIDISNIEANLIKITKTGINFKSTLKSLCNQLSPKASEKKIELICETEVPDSEAFIITDSTKLTQILSNLMNNAIKFTDKGYVKVSCMKRDNMLEFCVSDTGIGIPENYHQKIFDRFFQVQSTNSRLYEGTGLGLAISKANVELMGGKIWLSSEPGQGASFYFTIPYEKQVVKAVPVIEKRASEGSVFKTERTILVAEDIESNFKLITSFLSGTNSRIIRAVNGKEAVEIALSEKNLDLILMDIKMPVLDGYTAIKLIRETNSIIPIIAQTAYADDAEKAAEYGCNGFISKPFNKKQLLNVLSNFI